MELIVQHAWGCSISLHSAHPSLCNKQRVKFGLACHLESGSDKQACLCYHQQWRVHPIIQKKQKLFKVSSFKGRTHNDEDGASCRGPKLTQKSVKLSYTEKEREKILVECPDMVNHQVASTGENQETIARSPKIKRLLNAWLELLLTRASVPVKEELNEENELPNEIVEVNPRTGVLHARSLLKPVLKTVALRFWALDVAIKLSLLLISSGYILISLLYGVETAQELMPLWIITPFLIALYIQMIKGVISLYKFFFWMITRPVAIPINCCRFVINFVAEGKVNTLLFQPIKDVLTKDYKGILLRKLKERIEELNKERIAFIESHWRSYFMIVKFLRNAKLIK